MYHGFSGHRFFFLLLLVSAVALCLLYIDFPPFVFITPEQHWVLLIFTGLRGLKVVDQKLRHSLQVG